MSASLNTLRIHTALVGTSLALFVFYLLEIIQKPIGNYGGLSCLYHISHDTGKNGDGGALIDIIVVVLTLLAAMTLSRCVAHGANAKNKKNYKVQGLFVSLKKLGGSKVENRPTHWLNVLLILLHVTSLVCLMMVSFSINRSKKGSVPDGVKDSCDIDSDRAPLASTFSWIILLLAILVELMISSSSWGDHDEDVQTAHYSFSKIPKEDLHLYSTNEREKTYAVLRWLVLTFVAITCIIAFMTSLNPDLSCSETLIRLLLAAVIFAIEAMVVSAVRPRSKSKLFITMTASLAVFGYVSLVYIHLIRDAGAGSCTDIKKDKLMRTSDQKLLRDTTQLAFYGVIGFAILEALFMLMSCGMPTQSSRTPVASQQEMVSMIGPESPDFQPHVRMDNKNTLLRNKQNNVEIQFV